MTTNIYLDVPLSITLNAPLHIGSGYGRGLTRRAIVRDAAGASYIPGAALKGRVRSACEALAREAFPRETGLVVCGLKTSQVDGDREGRRHAPERCIVCRTFGAIGGNAPDGRGLRWENAYQHPRPDASRWTIMERTQVQLNRSRGMAAEERLYSGECAAPSLRFSGRVVGWLEATRCTAGIGYYEVALLLAGLRLIDTLGGMRRRGAGLCEIGLPEEISVRSREPDLSERFALADLLSVTEALDLFADEIP